MDHQWRFLPEAKGSQASPVFSDCSYNFNKYIKTFSLVSEILLCWVLLPAHLSPILLEYFYKE